MIPDWKQALRAACAALSPDGKVHVVDFGDLKGLGRMAERVLRGWLGLFHVAPREELLRTIEKNGAGAGLRLLAGRYAFIWTADRTGQSW